MTINPRNNGRGKSWRTGIPNTSGHQFHCSELKPGEVYFLHGTGCRKCPDCLSCTEEDCTWTSKDGYGTAYVKEV